MMHSPEHLSRITQSKVSTVYALSAMKKAFALYQLLKKYNFCDYLTMKEAQTISSDLQTIDNALLGTYECLYNKIMETHGDSTPASPLHFSVLDEE